MPVTRQFVQRDPRYSIPMAVDACVEFNFPNPSGRRLVLPLLELSVSGLSFIVDHELPLLVRGARLEGVLVRVGDSEISGRLLLKRLTRGVRSEAIYGGVFYPETEQDQNKIGAVLTGLASRA